jgi:hypothetical protein
MECKYELLYSRIVAQLRTLRFTVMGELDPPIAVMGLVFWHLPVIALDAPVPLTVMGELDSLIGVPMERSIAGKSSAIES